MSTAYYQVEFLPDGSEHRKILGIRTFEKMGEKQPRLVFTWEVNPALYLWIAEAHFVRDEYGKLFDRDEFVTEIVGNCHVQRYDIKDTGHE